MMGKVHARTAEGFFLDSLYAESSHLLASTCHFFVRRISARSFQPEEAGSLRLFTKLEHAPPYPVYLVLTSQKEASRRWRGKDG